MVHGRAAKTSLLFTCLTNSNERILGHIELRSISSHPPLPRFLKSPRDSPVQHHGRHPGAPQEEVWRCCPCPNRYVFRSIHPFIHAPVPRDAWMGSDTGKLRQTRLIEGIFSLVSYRWKGHSQTQAEAQCRPQCQRRQEAAGHSQEAEHPAHPGH